jgi:hypothetical protein
LEEHNNFSAAMREEIERRKLAPERMGEMASGEGKYNRLGPNFQHQVTLSMLEFAYGKPTAFVAADVDLGVQFEKRVIGVKDEDV